MQWDTQILAIIRDLSVTFFGAFIGVIGGWIYSSKIAKWQMEKQNTEIRNNELQLLKQKFKKLAIELRNNKNEVMKLEDTLGKINYARVDMWEWAETIVDAFSFKYYDNLLLSGLNKYLPNDIDEEVFISYNMVFELQNMVRQARKAHSYHYGHGADEESANQLHNDVQNYTLTVIDHLDYSVNKIYDYKDNNN